MLKIDNNEIVVEKKEKAVKINTINNMFKLGEVLIIRGFPFQIHNINDFGLKLRLLTK